MRKFYTATMGCKINQYETEAVSEAWERAGDIRVSGAADADVILVNSCAVTARAVSDLRANVRRLHRENPEAEIIVTGCAAQVLADEIAGLEGVTQIVPQDRKGELAGDDTLCAPSYINDFPRARAVVKVQDGCSHRCTYCIVPLARGKSRSREFGDILAEMGALLDKGFRELIISGINLSHFGRDLSDKPDFWDLIHAMDNEFGPEWAGRARLRISSVEPGQLGDKALDVLGRSGMVCPQVHLSLQSGDPQVLKAMGRGHYSPDQAVEFMDRLEEFWPVFGLGADILTGFPGETDEMFMNTVAVCERLPLTYAHVFPYSPRPGTPAATMPGQVPGDVKKSRAARLRSVAEAKKAAFMKRVAGLEQVNVLVQDEAGRGVSEYYAPCRVSGPVGAVQPKILVTAIPMGIEDGVIVARVEGDQ